jgi:acetyl-CoA C-acetyltransferase
MRKTVVVAANRTAVGAFGGQFKNVSAVDLGVAVVKNIIEKTGIDPSIIDELISGNVLGAGLGQNVARQILINSGIPNNVTAFSINKVCGSGMKAVSLAKLMIESGEAEVIIAGGTENMSQAPYLLPNERWGSRMGNKTIVDSMINDGLWDIFNNYHMGITAENLAEKYKLTRKELDEFACQSQNRTERAMNSGKFKDEIVPVIVPQRRKEPIIVDTDEFPKKGMTMEKLSKLRPAFKKDGVVTAGNSSGINDGAAFLLLMSEEKAYKLGLTPLAELVDWASGGVDPSIMGFGPVPSILKIMKKSGWKMSEIELAELNEAFASQSLAVLKGLEENDMKISTDIVNVNGGAISIGHPIGASGARIIVTLLHEMKRRKSKKGLASLCIGGGMGISTLWEMK